MKSYAVAAALATLLVATAHAAKPGRKRTRTQHKSLNKASATYDPYLGISEQRKLEGHGDHGSMSMSMDHDDHDHDSHASGQSRDDVTVEDAVEDTVEDTVEDETDPATLDDESAAGARVIGTAVSALAAAGAIALF